MADNQATPEPMERQTHPDGLNCLSDGSLSRRIHSFAGRRRWRFRILMCRFSNLVYNPEGRSHGISACAFQLADIEC